MCVFTFTDACMCECTYMCGDNDVRDNNELADELSQAYGHQGQKHAECVCACLCHNKWVCGVGKSVIFKILTM